MKQIIKDLILLKECKIGEPTSSIYGVNTNSEDGWILIDAGLNFDFNTELKKINLNPKNITYCLLTHGHLDHVDGCRELIEINPKIHFYLHKGDLVLAESYLKENCENSKKIFNNTDTFIQEITDLQLGKYFFKCIHTPGHTPGGMVYLTRIENHKVLFAGDICGGGMKINGGDHAIFKKSLRNLLNLNADILCDGHMNVIQPAKEVFMYIEGCLKINECLHVGFEVDSNNIENWLELASISFQMKIYDTAWGACHYALKLNPEHSKAKKVWKQIQAQNPPKYEFVERYLKNGLKNG